MCTIDSIKLQVMVFSWFKLIVSVYIFGAGIYFASSTDLQQAFGLQFLSYGLSLIFLALLSGCIIFPHKYAVNRHNRLLLAVAFVFDSIVFAELINFGLTVGSYIPPAFPKELQMDCLRNQPLKYTTEKCMPFYNSDRTAGMRLLWEYYYSDRGNKDSFQVLTNFGEGTCCGFFQPFRCIPNMAKFPRTRLQDGIDSYLLEHRVICSQHDNYYPRQSECIDYKDFAADPPIIGGCQHDLGVGFCLDAEISPASTGCASAVEDYATQLIEPHSIMLLVSSGMSLLFMTYSCCMWWKRKSTDLFPEFVTEVKVGQQYKYVKDQFEVVPRKDLLILEGFVPPPDGHGLELTDLTPLESTPQTPGRNDAKGGVVAKTAVKQGAVGVAVDPAAAHSVTKKPAPSSATRTGGRIHPVEENIES